MQAKYGVPYTSTLMQFTRHLGFLKLVAGVKRSVSSDVLLSEMCHKPFQFYWMRSVCNFWNKVCTANSDLLKKVARADVHLSHESDKCWAAEVARALNAYPGLQGYAAETMAGMGKFDVARVTKAWTEQFVGRLQQATGDPRDPDLGPQGQRKLCTYNAYFRQEDMGNWWQLPRHLTAGATLAPNVVRSVSRFRLGSHGLGVEWGRYHHKPWAERLCVRCGALGVQQPQVDDEKHMVFECGSFEGWRSSLRFAGLFENVAHGDMRQFMLNADGVRVAEFIHQCIEEVDGWNGVNRNDGGVRIPSQAEQPRTG
jgi:hypothetical protein